MNDRGYLFSFTNVNYGCERKFQIVSCRIRDKDKRKQKFFVILHVSTREAVGFIIVNLSMYIIYTQIQRCTHARARPLLQKYTHTHTRMHAHSCLFTWDSSSFTSIMKKL